MTTVKYRCGDETKWFSLVEVLGTPNFLLSEKDIHDRLVEGEDGDKDFWDSVYAANIGEFNGIELGEYMDIYASFQEDPENPAIPLIRYMIALTQCPMEDTERLAAMGKGKFADELDIPMSEDEKEYLAELEEDENE